MSKGLYRTVHLGSHGGYDWLASEHTLDDLLGLCPEIVIGKYLAVTSFDSGPLSLSNQEKASGWESRKGIAYSPNIVGIDGRLPHDLYDEWYVFETQTDLGELADPAINIFEQPIQSRRVHAFVNFGGFAFHRPEVEGLTSLFWEQLDLLRPESYIADGDYLNIASANKQVVETMREALPSPV